MAASSAMILLPPRHTAQSPHSAKKSSGSSSTDSFAPKLEKARKLNLSAKPAAAPAAKTAATVVVKSAPSKERAEANPDDSQESTEKDAAAAKADAKKSADDTNEMTETSAEEATKKASGAKGAAIAQSAVVEQKRPAKLAKPAQVKSTASTRQPSPDQVVSGKPIDGAAGSAEEADGADADSQLTAIGNGFYGSGKVVDRDAGSAADEGSADAAGEGGGPADASADASASAKAAVADPLATPAAKIATVAEAGPALEPDATPTAVDASTLLSALGTSTAVPLSAATGHAGPTEAAASPRANFVDDNHPTIVSSIAGQLMPKGGTMHIRLDPPELGALQVTVHMKDGAMTASFQTSNDDTTKLLTRSLGQLKNGLESAGMSVEKLHVEQAPKDTDQQDSQSGSKQPAQEQQQQAQQDQQRREMVQRMWRKLAGGDPLDLVA